MKFDTYTSHPTICNRHGYFDRSCVHCVTLFVLYGFPTSMCSFNRTFCLGKSCDIYDPINIKPIYVQLNLFVL